MNLHDQFGGREHMCLHNSLGKLYASYVLLIN